MMTSGQDHISQYQRFRQLMEAVKASAGKVAHGESVVPYVGEFEELREFLVENTAFLFHLAKDDIRMADALALRHHRMVHWIVYLVQPPEDIEESADQVLAAQRMEELLASVLNEAGAN